VGTIKLVFVLENYYPSIGGVETLFQTLAEGLAKEHNILVITRKLKHTKSYEVINDVHVHRVMTFGSRNLFTFLALPKILKLAKDADIINTTTYNAAPPARLAARLLKKPCILTVHEILGDRWGLNLGLLSAWVHKRLERLIIDLNFDLYICVSQATRSDLINIKPKVHSRVVYNGVDTVFWDPARYDGQSIRDKYHLNGKYVCLFYGRAGITKGAEYLVKSAKLVNDVHFFLILSKDKQAKKIYALAKGLSNVQIIDSVPRNELPNYIKMADCISIPSLSEGFGYTTVESCCMGKPVVASEVGSIPEVIFGNFILVNPKDPVSLAAGIIELKAGRGNHANYKDFSISEHIRTYKEVVLI